MTIISQAAGILYIRWASKVGICGIFLITIIFCKIIASYNIVWLINKATGKLHLDMLTHFLEASPILIENFQPGKIINRFSNDIGAIDGLLSSVILEYIDASIRFFMTVLYTIIIAPFLVAEGIILFIAYSILVYLFKQVI